MSADAPTLALIRRLLELEATDNGQREFHMLLRTHAPALLRLLESALGVVEAAEELSDALEGADLSLSAIAKCVSLDAALTLHATRMKEIEGV